jgi:hypothetical protein
MREYQLQFTTSKIGEREKNLIERNRSIEVSSDTPRILSSSPRRSTAQQKEFVFYYVSNLFWIFFYYRRVHASFEQLWKRKRTTGHESFLQLFRKRVFSQTKQIITIREFCASASLLDTKKHKKGYLQPSIFPINCVISDTNTNDTLYFRQLS